jgi:hypothetical protein
MANIDYKIQRALMNQWDAVRACIERLNNSATVSPTDPLKLFRVTHSDEDLVTFAIGRTLLIFPERANDMQNKMHIVVTGQLSIDKKQFEAKGEIRTIGFKSAAGYFRLKHDGTLQHVFGAHYDLTEDEVGHPAFHAQLNSFLDFVDEVQGRYGSAPLQVTNEMKNVLKTVRLPSAQMDYFSLLIQAMADHLISPTYSTAADIETFRELLQKNKAIHGRAYDIKRLQIPAATACYRSVHWYP